METKEAILTDETNPQEFKNDRGSGDHSQIKGWGIDADTENDPTYPMKNRTNEEHNGYSWERPVQQPQTVEIFKSVERPNITAVFGTSIPPTGLSGRIRRFAFKYSESSYGRWLPLVLADRVGMIEALIADIRQGKFPNLYKELGWSGEWKYAKGRMIRRIAGVALVISGIILVNKMTSRAKT